MHTTQQVTKSQQTVIETVMRMTINDPGFKMSLKLDLDFCRKAAS